MRFGSVLGKVLPSLSHDVAWPRFNAAVKERDFVGAEAMGRVLLARKPRHRVLRVRFAHVLEKLGRADEVHAVIADGLARTDLAAITATLADLYSEHEMPQDAVGGWRLIPRGTSALCSMEHPNASIDGYKIITKIIDRTSRSAARELRFYADVRGRSRELQLLAPRVLDIRGVPRSRLVALTLEMIEGHRPGIADVAAVKNAWHGINRASRELEESGFVARRSQLRDLAVRTVAGYLRHRLPILPTFAWIHTPIAAAHIFSTLHRRLTALGAPQRWSGAVARLRALWFDRGLHRRVDPRVHHAFVHGDFHEANLIVDRATGACRVVDWESASWGPPSADVSTFMVGLFRLEFEHLVRHGFLDLTADFAASRAIRDPIAQVLLEVTMIAGWLGTRTLTQLEESYSCTVEPLLETVAEHAVALPSHRAEGVRATGPRSM